MMSRLAHAAGLLALGVFSLSAGAQNVVLNPGFEQGQAPWLTWAGASFVAESGTVHAGSTSARITNRTESWQGPVQSLVGVLVPGTSYRVSAWVRVDGSASEPIGITLAHEDAAGLQYRTLVSGEVVDHRWTQIVDFFQYASDGPATRDEFYFQGPAPGVDMLVDDVEIVPLSDQWRSEADQQILDLRTRPLELRIVDSQGQPVPDATVEVRQVRREFPFGTAIAASPLQNEPRYGEYIASRFNWGVHENAAKWYSTERQQGQVDYSKADDVLDWAVQHDITMRGHTIFWAPTQWQPDWVPGLDDASLATAVEDRLESVVAYFRGRLKHWDVNNEMLHGSFFADRLGPGIRSWMFNRTHELDPQARLFLNDFDIIAGGAMLAPYKNQIQAFLDEGLPLHAIGVQGHFTSVSPYSLKYRLDQLAEFDLPIWITEFDVVNADENLRADDLETFYRVAFAHPAVAGILMWGFWEGSHWRGPDAALVNQDWSLNAAGQRFDELLEEWRTDVVMQSDAEGQVALRAFHGQHEITVTPPGGSPELYLLEVAPGEGPVVWQSSGQLFADSFESVLR